MRIIYCNWCGATPGEPTKCPAGTNGVHSFAESNTAVYCDWCGATPGHITECPAGANGVHSFKKSRKS
ncbi:MAG: hypothetical protein ACE5GU_00645 [Candidatus Scalinduaceae bacterium]